MADQQNARDELIRCANVVHSDPVDLVQFGEGNPALTDHTFQLLAACRELRILRIGACKGVSDNRLAMLRLNNKLEEVEATCPGFDDQCMEELTLHVGLRTLVVGSLPVTDTGIKNIRRLKRLEKLDLHHTLIGDAGMDGIRDMPSLKHLDLFGTNVGDSGLATICDLHLKSLVLGKTGITNAATASLARMRHLERLDLRYTRISDEGLPNLQGLQQLKTLDLRGTLVSPGGVARLQRNLASTKIQH